MFTFNAKTNKFCCTCKHWFDPACACITPLAPAINSWGVTCDAYNDRRMCLKKNLQKSAVDTCGMYECKLSLK